MTTPAPADPVLADPVLIVIDASALAGLVLPDEAATGLAQILQKAAPIAPQLLWAEMRNLLLMAERRRRVDAGAVAIALGVVEGLQIALDQQPSSDRVMALARRQGLTIYDALYLELALRRQAALASTDAALIRAARAEGVTVV